MDNKRLTPPAGARKLTPLELNNPHFKISGKHTVVSTADKVKK